MWNEEKHIAKVKPYTDILVKNLNQLGIEFSDNDDKLENVIFRFKNTEVKISKHSFYGFSRLIFITKDGKEKNSSELIPITDEMYIATYMKPIVLKLLGIK